MNGNVVSNIFLFLIRGIDDCDHSELSYEFSSVSVDSVGFSRYTVK